MTEVISHSLKTAIDTYMSTEADYLEACAASDDDHDDLWNAKDAAEQAFMRHPCQSSADVHTKIRFALANANLKDSLESPYVGHEATTTEIFLRSLILEAQAPSAPSSPPTDWTVEAMFAEWRAARDADYRGEPEPAARYAVYRSLQARIVEAVPLSARDLAIQFFVDTDAGDSDWSQRFFETIQSVISGETAVATVSTFEEAK